MVLGEDAQAMDVLPIITCVLWMHIQGLIQLKYNQCTGVLSIKALPLVAQAVGSYLVRTPEQPCHHRLVYIVR